MVNYWVGHFLHNPSFNDIKRRLIVTIGILFNLGLLGYFKYCDFFIENVNALFGLNMPLLNILLPLGISFFTFQQLSFVIDSYRRTSLKYDFLSYCMFVTFFPQLIAGPIVLPTEMLPQFEDANNKRVNYQNLSKGLYIFAIGLAKKVILADNLANFANSGFDTMGSLSFLEAWITSLSYTFQLYFDFSGYCDMAIGIGLMFNIKIPINFNSPYKSVNIQDFWKRWHITLGRFLTNYLYIPLGGNRKGHQRTLINIAKATPDIQYKFYFPPYADIWWVVAEQDSQKLKKYWNFKQYVIDESSKYPNIEVYDFQCDESIISIASNYKDMMHFSSTVSSEIIQRISRGENLVTSTHFNSLEKLQEITKKARPKYLQVPGIEAKLQDSEPDQN